MGANIGWLFYKDYFKDLNYADLQKSEKNIKEKVANIISQTPVIQESEILGNVHFKATTTYPGLLLGSGNVHELPSVEGQAILGFHFDYTNGLPVIQGSSIKGVLRSAFDCREYIQEILNDENFDVEALEKEIFDNGDIFFDATILQADGFGKILGDDFITPHKNSKKTKDSNGELIPDELCNPIPLRFIKVLPNVTFRFDFELSDGILTKDDKRKLFEKILNDIGIGAKTNVGYGKFINFLSYETQEEQKENEFKNLLLSENIQVIENFKNAHPNHSQNIKLQNRIDELKALQQQSQFVKINEEAQKAFENTIAQKDKNKRKQWLQAWIKKWEDEKNNRGSSLILELVEEAKQQLK